MERQDPGWPNSEWPYDEEALFSFYDDGDLFINYNYNDLTGVAPEQPLLPLMEPPPFPTGVDNFSLLPPDEMAPLDFVFNLGVGLSDMGSISPGVSDTTDFTGSPSDVNNFTGSPGIYEGFDFSPSVPACPPSILPVFLNSIPMQTPFGQQVTSLQTVAPLSTPFFQQETELPLLSFPSTPGTTQQSESPPQALADTHQPNKTHKHKKPRPVLSAYDPS